MKASTVHELKKELKLRSAADLVELCARLARFKKDNKELLTYLLFEADDEKAYIESVKAEIDTQFSEINRSNALHLVKKSLRKILRNTNKYIRYAGSKEVEIELLIHYLLRLRASRIPIHKSTTLINLKEAQLKKIIKILPTLHEDLQFDYKEQVAELTNW